MFGDDAWLAGFADGEGYFQVAPHGAAFGVRFFVKLRADDIGVLNALRDEFGGAINWVWPEGGSPQAQWAVAGKRDLAKLVAYFDRFPLRAKKSRDYILWREAALAYIQRGGYAAELPLIREALMELRRYEGEVAAPPQLESPQLRLVG